MVKTAAKVADEALSWITPEKLPGKPMAWRSHSIIRVSISVAAGEVCQSMHCTAMVDTRKSANIAGGVAFDGK